MEAVNIRTVPTAYRTTWISVADKLVKVNYPLLLGVTLLTVGFGALGYLIKPFGIYITSFALTFIHPGLMLMTSDFIKKDKSNFNRIFFAFNDQALITRLVPLAVFNVLYAFLSHFILRDSLPLQVFFAVIALPLTYFSIPLITFKNMRFTDTISYSIQAVIKNISPLLQFWILFTLIIIALAIPLGIPLLLYGLPLSSVVGYPIFASIFLNLDVNELNNSLKPNPT